MDLDRMLTRRRSTPWTYVLGGVALGVATLAQIALAQALPGVSPWLFYLPAIVATAIFGAVTPSLLVTAGALVLPPLLRALGLGDPARSIGTAADWVEGGLVVLTGVAVALLGLSIRRALQRRQTAETARGEADERRREAVATLEALVRHAPIGFAFFDRDHRYVRVNEALARINGFDIEAHLGGRLADTLPTLAAVVDPVIDRVLATGETVADLELSGTTPAQPGVERAWITNFFPVLGPSREVVYVGITVTEITDRKRAEAKLAASEARWRDIAEALPQLVWTAPVAAAPDFINQRWRDFAGAQAVAGIRGWTDFVDEADRERATLLWEESRRAGRALDLECRLRGADGTPRWHLCRALPVPGPDGRVERYIGTCTDISDIVAARETLARSHADLEALVAERTAALETAHAQLRREMEERVAAEEMLRHAQKMEAIGRLTGGVAHDFNNLLTVVLGNIETVRRRVAQRAEPDGHDGWDGEAVGDLLAQAQDAGRRAATLTQQLLAFSRRQPLDPRPVDVNRLVQSTSELLRRVLGEKIAVETVLAGGLWRTEADAGQLENVLLNLAVNARDAMPDGGKLTLETANTLLDDAYAGQHQEVAAGQYVVICVSDTGSGMPPDVVERAFEPFFTTKPVGLGTGLGLSQVYGFVKQSGGHVKIYSEPGQGTTIKIYLPRLRREVPEVEVPAPSATASRPARSQESVLVVEDDAGVRRHVVGVLRELGYRVSAAPGGDEALEMIAQGETPDLLFTDVTLPNGWNGRDLAAKAQARLPRLKVLFTTAYARNAIVHHGRLDAGVQLVTKPFTRAELAARVRAALDDGSARAALLVEDEALVAMAAREMLRDLGFTPVVCASGADALAAFEAGQARFVVAVVDVGLPDVSGEEVARRLRARMPVVMATGYAVGEIRERFPGDEELEVIGKPYSIESLRGALRSLGFVTADDDQDRGSGDGVDDDAG